MERRKLVEPKCESVVVGTATMHHIDCMKYMATLPDKAFDLAIVDPPYGLDFANEKERKPTATRSAQFKFKRKLWDNAIPDAEYFKELKRVSVNQIIFGGNYFLDHLGNTNCVVVWDKQNPDGMRFSDGELAWCSFETALRIYRSLRTYRIEDQMHPTQKPVKLYEWLLNNYAKAGNKILDTHGGSLSSVIACLNKGFEIVVCEKDADYFKDGVQRVINSQKQGKFFTGK
jgi:site-specific DNA-methyltransferase (adenine-specific)